jgi:hypothetical protein
MNVKTLMTIKAMDCLLIGLLDVTAWALAGAYLFFTLGFGYYTIHPGTTKSEIE